MLGLPSAKPEGLLPSPSYPHWAEAVAMLPIELDVDLRASGDYSTAGATSRYHSVAAHLAACGPCAEAYRGLLAPPPG